MIANGSSNGCAWWWAQHLGSEDNEQVRILQSYGLRSETIEDMLNEMMAFAVGTPCKNPFYQLNLSPAPGECLTEKDWNRAREIEEEEHGLKGQPYFMVMHTKDCEQHVHLIHGRINLETGKTISDSHDARKNHAIARKIERELGLQKVIGPYDLEPGMPRPKRAPKRWESLRAYKTGINIDDLTAEITELHRQSQNGQEFQTALKLHGYQLVIGRRGLLILDSAGKEHSLAKRIEGVNTAELNAFMRNVDRAALPTLEQGKAQYQERKIAGLEADRASIRDQIQWQEALEKAAIAKEEKERRFVEPERHAPAGPARPPQTQEQPKEETRAGREQAAPTRREERQWPVNPPQHQAWPEFEKAAIAATRDERTQDLRGPAAQVWAAWCEIDKDAALTPAQEEEARRLGVSIHEAREKVIAAALAGKTVSFSVPLKEVFAASLDDRGISFAAVTKEEAERSHREAEFAKAAGHYAPRFKQGEIVIVTEQRPEYRRDDQAILPARVHKLDQSLAEKFTKHLGIRSQLQGIDATLRLSDERMEQRRAERETTRLERATDTKPPIRVTLKRAATRADANAKQVLHKSVAAIEKTASIAASFGKMFEIVGSLVEGIIAAPKLTPQQIHEGEKAKDRRDAEADFTIDFSRATAEAAQQRQQQENEREAARQRPRDEERELGR